MPSKGTPVKTLRVPLHLVERIEAAIDSANVRRFATPYDWSSWAIKALTEKIRHLERGRTASKRRPGRRAAARQLPPAVEVQA